MIFSWFFYDCFMIFFINFSWCFYDCFMMFSWFFNALCMISCRFFDEFFTDCLMILRCFRWVFFKNVLLAAAASTFSFLDYQTFLCLFLAFSLPRVEVGENVCRQSWLGACPVRLGWERVASEVVPLSFLCSLKCCLLENVLLAAAGSTFCFWLQREARFFLIFQWFLKDF